MEQVSVQINIGKVEKDIIDALVAVLKGLIKDKKSIAEVVGAEMGSLIKVVGEAGAVIDELKNGDNIAAAAYLALQLESLK